MRSNRIESPTVFRSLSRSVPFVLLAGLAAAASPAAGAGFEITPTFSYRSSDYGCTGASDFPVRAPACGVGVESDAENGEAFGVLAGFAISRGWAIEVLAGREETELDVEPLPGFEFLVPPEDADFTITHLQAGVARTWGDGAVQPFAGVAAGVSRVEAESPEQHHIEFDEDALSASAGAGVKIGLTDWLGLRLEGRAYWVDLPEEVGGSFTETELAGGLIFRF